MEGQDDMCEILQLHWTIIPKIAPQPWIVCSGCAGPSAFRSSDKIRLNANGRKLDAWLIYKCITCDSTWNCPIFERKSVGDIDAATLDALHSNDLGWIRAEAFNLEALRRKSRRIDHFAEVEVRKEVVRASSGWTRLAIEFSVPLPANVRLERLLASELRLSRSQLQSLQKNGLLQANSARADMLRRPVRDGTLIIMDLPDPKDRRQVWDSPPADPFPV